jgi:hypothetical protein
MLKTTNPVVCPDANIALRVCACGTQFTPDLRVPDQACCSNKCRQKKYRGSPEQLVLKQRRRESRMAQKIERHIRGKAIVPVFAARTMDGEIFFLKSRKPGKRKDSPREGQRGQAPKSTHRAGLNTVTPDTITKLINLSPDDVVRERYLQEEVIHPWRRAQPQR